MKMNQYNIKSKMFDFGLILGGSFIPSWSVILGLTSGSYIQNHGPAHIIFKPFTAEKSEHDPTARDISPHEPPQLWGLMRTYAFYWQEFVSMFLGWLQLLFVKVTQISEPNFQEKKYETSVRRLGKATLTQFTPYADIILQDFTLLLNYATHLPSLIYQHIPKLFFE